MKQIHVITTGGAIAMKRSLMVGGSVPSLKGNDLLALLPSDGIDLAFEEFSNVPGSHFTPLNALKLAQRIESVLMAPDVHGVVVTHGTDTMEETAFLLDLTINNPKPIVLTGAMRPVTNPAYDGVANLASAIHLAASPEARDFGVMIVFHDEVHAASEVQKVHTQAQNAFQSPGSGPLGRVDRGRVWLHHRPNRRQYIPCSRLEEMVDLIRITQGADDRMLRHSIEDGVAGIVIESFGSGRVPPWWLPTIGEAIKQRTIVVITSRCQAGSLGDEHGYVGSYHDLERMGMLIAHNLEGCKARIKLMAALGAARNSSELRKWFES
jgi:L-asparaginase